LTRKTFDPAKHFTRVLMQQGRVQLDADWNEQAAIALHYLRSLTRDLIGEAAGPPNNLGFEIGVIETNILTIGGGHYYVGGILCENGTPIAILDSDAHNKTVTVQLSDFVVDGVEFAKDQYVEAFPNPTNANPVNVIDANPAAGVITLS